MSGALHDFIVLVRQTYEARGRAGDALPEEIRPYVALIDQLELPSQRIEAVRGARARRPAGLRFWDDALQDADDDFATSLDALKETFRWRTFYAESDWSRPFLANFAAGELVGPGCAIPSRDLVLGVLLMGPHTFYPAHAHPALELYTVLAGKPQFKAGEGAWRTLENGMFVFHPADMEHTMQTLERPMLALYAWRGDITAPSYYWREGQKVYPPKVQ